MQAVQTDSEAKIHRLEEKVEEQRELASKALREMALEMEQSSGRRLQQALHSAAEQHSARIQELEEQTQSMVEAVRREAEAEISSADS